ncbi:IS4 family transposase [Allorhizocola rhizosphaerae]|uniref:IS4 family transposase n=1 Tax=Allorhizocola rhizosphaerae TaxID=1872709 RepID=UPI001FE5C8B5|nr:IS4 family transposase [Allorhizocola rhizosphaerae]
MVKVAGGVFAPGHLGELTQLIPFEMVDEALRATATVRSRVRELPSRVVVYLLLAAALFEGQGYGQVWTRLCAGLGADAPKAPSRQALWQARARVGVRPLRWLFDLLRGPAPATVRWRGLLVCAVDGTTAVVPDTAANTTRWPKQGGNHGGCGYPLIRVVALVACGTRTLIDAVFGPCSSGETTYAWRLLPSLREGMLLLADRNFAAGKLFRAVADSRAHALIRAKTSSSGPKLPVLHRLADGSWLSRFGGVQVRVIDAQIAIATTAGRHTGHYRWITTLTDHRRYPAFELAQIYHERWEIETCYLELKSTILGGRVLRARTPARVEQEVYALLIVYQLLRTAIADTALAAGIDPDRASFTIALNAARDQLINAASVIAEVVVDLIGVIGRQVLAQLMPDRRIRVNPRIVKRAISKYQARGPNVNRTSYKATLNIDILPPPSP